MGAYLLTLGEKHNTFKLRGIEEIMRSSEKGYTLVAVIVAIGVMSILMAAAVPVWRHVMKREKEKELLFRGNQYIEAIDRYYRKFGRLPIQLEELLKTKCIRKLYTDPMTKDGKWELINFRGGLPEDRRRLPGAESSQPLATNSIIGVYSKSKDKSIFIYQGKNQYNQWKFSYKLAPRQRGGRQPPKGDQMGVPADRRK